MEGVGLYFCMSYEKKKHTTSGNATAKITTVRGRWFKVITLNGSSPLLLLNFDSWYIGPYEHSCTTNCVARVHKWIRSTFSPPEDGVWVQLYLESQTESRTKLANQYIFLN